MILVKELLNNLKKNKISFFTGVPDSVLKNLLSYFDELNDNKHIIAANEGSAISIGIGHYLSSKKIPCVYLQNSGLGNIINPITSLCIPHDIRPLLIIGHRHTLPQHKVMGEIDEKLLELIDYSPYIIVKGSNNVK